MALVGFNKVSTLPASLAPNTMYFVENEGFAEFYLTDNSGVAKMVGNSMMINMLISEALASWSGDTSTIDIVDDIDARDALIATLDRNAMILVVDASEDPTVDSGSALYAYAASSDTIYKIAEYESMDVVVTWESITGKPASTPSQIDSAVTQAHSHSNKTVLDKFTESEGELLYDGEPIRTSWDTDNW